ncbi:MAG: hypothetical protein K2X27_25700 [Candidatus Obscuribacterales bacterium]|nr:hypothetical protein [Candidatus Obscuribacterales bacterium]
MSNLKQSVLLTAVALLVCGSFAGQQAYAKRAFPALKGLAKARVKVTVSEDVKYQMHAIGAGNFIVGGELHKLVESKLKDVGISTGGDADGPSFNLQVDIDMSNDEFEIVGTYSDFVSLVRDPSQKFETTLWSKTVHPSTDDTKGLKDGVTALMDAFDVDRMAANAEKK